MSTEQFQEGFTLSKSTLRALDITDNMPPRLRECVHEFGTAIVDACVRMGVTEPRHIRFLVHEIWQGARQPAQRTNIGRNKTERSSPVLAHLDWLLVQSGSNVNAATLLRVLLQGGMVILPYNPGSVMVDASMEEVSAFEPRLSKPEKHRRRLKAAVVAQAKRLWPHLFEDRNAS